MRPPISGAFLLTVCLGLSISPSYAQTDIDEPADQGPAPPYLATIEGTVDLDRDGTREAADVGMPLVSGDRLHTASGRAEVLWESGTAMFVDQGSAVELASEELVQLLAGRINVDLTFQPDAPPFRIDTPAGSVWLRREGSYRVRLDARGREPEVELTVIRGGGEIRNDFGSMLVGAGERSTALASARPTMAAWSNVASLDGFDRWSDERRRTRLSTAAASTAYLPNELQTYAGTFDQYGAWRNDPAYGAVWYPYAAGWQPYSSGYWRDVRRHGWVWIGYDPWSWPTHHYGRWHFGASGWFWKPLRGWSSAWVSWAITPGFVGWTPLGWRSSWDRGPFGHPGTHGPYGLYDTRGVYTPWNRWTVVSSTHFGSVRHINRYAVAPHTFARGGSSFVVQRVPPRVPRHVAVPRGARGGSIVAGSPTRVPPTTRINRGSWGAAGPIGGVSRPPEQESPYDRAQRVASQRSWPNDIQGPGSRPRYGTSTQPLPYPPQYQAPVPGPRQAVPRTRTPQGAVQPISPGAPQRVAEPERREVPLRVAPSRSPRSEATPAPRTRRSDSAQGGSSPRREPAARPVAVPRHAAPQSAPAEAAQPRGGQNRESGARTEGSRDSRGEGRARPRHP